ncbi:hypothetical protein [Ktedonobacter racemifer]|uniref:hypothetical protein n=1 Tax=Ktedonobacter racemifer TaxID=363277 RepID=UPI0012F94F62|nr:hypothetical protein [Ktedonobacter racemifer]
MFIDFLLTDWPLLRGIRPSQKALVGLIPAGEGMNMLNSLPTALPVALLHQSPPRR